MKWWHIALVVAIIFGGIWVFRSVTTPAPGTKIDDQGREHVSYEEVDKTIYNSNPPTSGRHYEIPAKAGIYETPQHDGQLIHSLEHGYVIISYNCKVHLGDSKTGRLEDSKKKVLTVFAHEEDASSSADIGKPIEASGSATSESDACKILVKNLEELAKKKRLWKLVVVPRPTLDTTIALTAWGYIDKFDPPAGGFDAKRIERFIDYHRDHGPEQTAE